MRHKTRHTANPDKVMFGGIVRIKQQKIDVIASPVVGTDIYHAEATTFCVVRQDIYADISVLLLETRNGFWVYWKVDAVEI